MFPEAELSFASHHWPRWGKEKVRQHVSDQRDMYKFINDQTLRMANMGYDSEEIAENMKLPDSIGKKFYNRGYYGSLNHNVKATYQLYLGFYNGNPATLHEHPRIEAAKRYIEAMGGPAKVLRIGRTAFNKGDYRWTAEVVNHLVYANPNNQEARQLQAAALEQMGFQAESGPWRDVYLSGAKELRDSKLYDVPPIVDPRSLPLAMLFDYSGIRINPEKANGKTINLGVNATDTGEKYTVVINNSVLFAHKAKDGDAYDGTLEATTEQIGELFGGLKSYDKLASDVKTTGRSGAIKDALALMDPMPKRIPLVTPIEKRAPQPSSGQMAQAKNE
jgi:alkyl sulfatase BDS1-like metallo-beta-lactamase superfamily hydrolase